MVGPITGCGVEAAPQAVSVTEVNRANAGIIMTALVPYI